MKWGGGEEITAGRSRIKRKWSGSKILSGKTARGGGMVKGQSRKKQLVESTGGREVSQNLSSGVLDA